MSTPFDPYHKWLGIPTAEQPPHHYRLLGVSLFETDPDVIEIAADQRMAHLRSFHTGPHSELTQKLLNEVAAARLCLLKPERRAAYDELLRRRLGQDQSRSAAPEQAARPPTENPPLLESIGAGKPAGLLDSPAPVKSVAAPKTSAVAATTKPVELAPKPAILPRSAAWDQAIAEACATQTVIQQPRRRWRVSQSMIWLVLRCGIAAGIAYGVVYGGLAAFTKWQEAESRRSSPVARSDAVPAPDKPSDASAAGSPDNSASSQTGSSAPQAGRSGASEPIFGTPDSFPSDRRPPDGERPPTVTPVVPPTPVAPTPAPTAEVGPSPPAFVRSQVPNEEAQQKSIGYLKEVLGENYLQASGVNPQIELAWKLASLANDTSDDPTTRYVLANQALDLAIKVCDVELASRLVGGFVSYYEVDAWDLRFKTLQRLAHSPRIGPESRSAIAKAAYGSAENAFGDDRYRSAAELATLSLNMATGFRDNLPREQARELADRSRQIQRRFNVVEAAQSVLGEDPDDPDANLVVGKFRCFVNQDWQGGLAYLKKANDEELRGLVERELMPPIQAADQVELADAWWELALRPQDPKDNWGFKSMRGRAAYWYRLAMPSLSGVSWAKAKRRAESP